MIGLNTKKLIYCHLLIDKVQKGVLRLFLISIEGQLANFLVKALPHPKFNSFISKLGMTNI